MEEEFEVIVKYERGEVGRSVSEVGRQLRELINYMESKSMSKLFTYQPKLKWASYIDSSGKRVTKPTNRIKAVYIIYGIRENPEGGV